MTIQRIRNLFFFAFMVVLVFYLIYAPEEEQQNWQYDSIFLVFFVILYGLQKLILGQREKKWPVQRILVRYKRGMLEWTLILLSLLVLVILAFDVWENGYRSMFVMILISMLLSTLRRPQSREYYIEKNQLYAPKLGKPLDIQKITYLEMNEKANLEVGYEGRIMEIKEWDTDLLQEIMNALMALNPAIKSSSEM